MLKSELSFLQSPGEEIAEMDGKAKLRFFRPEGDDSSSDEYDDSSSEDSGV